MVLVDTNVLLDIATRDPKWFEWSSTQLAPLINARQAAINPVIYAELAPCYRNERDLNLYLLPPADFKRLALPYSAAFPAARAFAAYRLTGGTRTSLLPDFFVGAHAEAEGHTLLTRDPARYGAYFPKVKLIAPA
jgi:predicted nucleic acid-binding protein